MGAEQSCRGKRKESNVAMDAAQHLLNAQLRAYESQCHEYIDDVFDAVSPRTSHNGSRAERTMQGDSHGARQGPKDKRSNMERNGSPYSKVRDDVYSVVRDSTPTAPHYNHPGPSCSAASGREFGARKYHSSQHFDSDKGRTGRGDAQIK